MLFESAGARFRTPAWLIAGAALAFTLGTQTLSPGPLRDSSAYLVALLPGLLTALVFRSVLAGVAVTLAPMYFVIGFMLRGLPAHSPMTALDRVWPLEPAWMLVYGSLYVFVVILPFLVIRERQLGHRTLRAYIAVMLPAYAGFLLYPTTAPSHGVLPSTGFAAWTLRLAYDIDTPANCFPSLHVAYAFVAAQACYRVHRGVGIAALIWATLIALSTLFTKQHYIVDVAAGAAMGGAASFVFLRSGPRQGTNQHARGAPRRAAYAVAFYVLMVAAFGVTYLTRG